MPARRVSIAMSHARIGFVPALRRATHTYGPPATVPATAHSRPTFRNSASTTSGHSRPYRSVDLTIECPSFNGMVFRDPPRSR